MKGAKDILCECGIFLRPVYVREAFGKFTKLLECSCGMSRKITIDGSLYKEETFKDNVLVKTMRLDEYSKKVYRYPPEGRYRVTCRLSKKDIPVDKARQDIP